MDKEKVLTEEKALAEELLTEDELDKVAGGAMTGTGVEKVISTPNILQNKFASSKELPTGSDDTSTPSNLQNKPASSGELPVWEGIIRGQLGPG